MNFEEIIEKHANLLNKQVVRHQAGKSRIRNIIASEKGGSVRKRQKYGRLSLVYAALFLILTIMNFLLVDILMPEKGDFPGRISQQSQLADLGNNLEITDNISYSLAEVLKWAE